MKIFNLMLGKGRGGLEQAALDYAEALHLAGVDAVSVTATDAWVNTVLDAQSLPRLSFTNYGSWDILAGWRLASLARSEGATHILCHGNRALRLALRHTKPSAQVVAVTHNYSIADVPRADAAFTITRDLALEVELLGVPKDRIFHVPNAVRIVSEKKPHTLYSTPPVIGTMGRMVRKKGFDVWLEALALLNARGCQFRALLGGDGEERSALEALAGEKRLTHTVEFLGWVEDKQQFFDRIDFFVLPSHEEAFGIVLIEAMAHGLPCIATSAAGPSEILHDKEDGLLVPRNDAAAMADAIARLLDDHAYAGELAQAGQRSVHTHYTLEAMARRLREALDALPARGLDIAA